MSETATLAFHVLGAPLCPVCDALMPYRDAAQTIVACETCALAYRLPTIRLSAEPMSYLSIPSLASTPPFQGQ